jgi:ribosomal protein S18 acetylase RimI-like enzyme
VKKTKKNMPRILPQINLVDKEAFEASESKLRDGFIMRAFWESNSNKILIARKKDTQAIVGYGIFSDCDLTDQRFGKKKRIPSVYLLRIGVRMQCQRQGIGRKLMNYLFENYPEHALSLDVNAENDQAVNFYRKNGLRIQKLYVTPEPDNVEFAMFETPLDKKGKRLDLNDPEMD